jgi:hypothetical protein
MTYGEVIAHFGSQAQAARALGINQASVSVWRLRGVPLGRQYQLEIVTTGALKVDEPLRRLKASA